MGESRFEMVLRVLLFGAMIAVSAMFLLRPVNDPDFFWHLKTGEWIRQHHELPTEDPFNDSSRSVDSVGKRFTLTAYWLSQVIFSVIHDQWGIPGIVALKFLTAALLVLALLRLRRGDPVVQAALTLAILPLLYGIYPFDRPQVFSFLLFAVLLIFLEKERTGPLAISGWRSYLPIPLLMLAWANLHGGHAIGQVIIVTYVALEGVKFLHPSLRPAGQERFRRLLIVGGAGCAASLLNPNTWHALEIALVPAPAWVGLLDYVSSVTFFRDLQQPLIALFWGALFLAAVSCLATSARADITWIALLAGTGYFGFVHVRYIPFFMICAVPVIGGFLSAQRALRWSRLVAAAGAVALVAYFSRNKMPDREQLGAALRVNETLYPVRAADFVLANNLQGNLYNTYIWGGYLLWRLGPERKVFVDGRGINPQATFDSSSINIAFARAAESPPYWENLLLRNGVGHLIIPRVRKRQGMIFEDTGRLTQALLENPRWFPVYADETALVFVLKTPAHRDVIARHGLPKERPLGWWLRNDQARGDQLASEGRREEAAAAYRDALRAEPGNADAWHNLGCVLGELGRLDGAVAAFEETLRLKPDHPTARKNLERIPGRPRR